MSDLPEERVSPTAPFHYTSMDVFGPFYIKEGHKSLKRYGLIFTCLTSRAVHLETLNSMEADSFISALRRFINIQGKVRELRSDQGTNFVGVNEFHLGEPCNGPCVPYLMSSLSRLRDHSISCHYLRHYFRACASVSFSWFDHAVPL